MLRKGGKLMSNSLSFDVTVNQIRDRLNLISLSQKLVSSNLANINTPGYVAKDVSFEKVLSESIKDQSVHLSTSDPEHISIPPDSPSVHNEAVIEKHAVNLDEEMMRLARNNIDYQYMITLLSKKFALLKHVIAEGAS